jgi:hypothetical protein
MRNWRDVHEPDDDPLFDGSLAQFHVNDVAALLYECKRLWALERKVSHRAWPPVTESGGRRAQFIRCKGRL